MNPIPDVLYIDEFILTRNSTLIYIVLAKNQPNFNISFWFLCRTLLYCVVPKLQKIITSYMKSYLGILYIHEFRITITMTVV